MTIEDILDEMENLIIDSTRVPFTEKRVIDAEEFARLVDSLRELLPTEINDAKRIMSERKRILEEAQTEAHSIIEQAKTYVNKLTDDSLITRQAHEQAAEVINQAKTAAKELRYDAIRYADDVFLHLEANIEKILSTVNTCHNELRQNSKGTTEKE